MSKRDDDWDQFDFNPLKFMIGCVKVVFGIIKWIVENLLLKR